MKHLMSATLALALLASSGAARAEEKIFAKAGITLATHNADAAQCRQAVQPQRVSVPRGNDVAMAVAMSNPNVSPLAGAVGGALGSAMVAGMAAQAAQEAAFGACMQRAGYVIPRVSRAEQKAYVMMTDAERSRWLAGFLASDRVEATTRRLTPALPAPSVGSSPFPVVAGSLSLVGGEVEPGTAGFTAKARVPGARLREALSIDGGKATVAAGETFFQTGSIGSAAGATELNLWCAPATVAKAKVQNQTVCLLDTNDGYAAYIATPDKWGRVRVLEPNPRTGLITSPIALDPVPEAEAPLVELRYEPFRMGIDGDFVRGSATVNGRTYVVGPAFGYFLYGYFDYGDTIAVPVGDETVVVTRTKGAKTYTVARKAP